MSEALLTTAVVAHFLKLNVEAVYPLMATQGCPAGTIGSHWCCEEARVRAWVEGCSVSPAHDPPHPPWVQGRMPPAPQPSLYGKSRGLGTGLRYDPADAR